MEVDTHAFKDAFVGGEREGFSVVYTDVQAHASVGVPFVAQKYDDQHLCVFVFETADAAEKERVHFPIRDRLAVKKVSADEVRAFALVGYRGIPAIAFLRDRTGKFAPI